MEKIAQKEKEIKEDERKEYFQKFLKFSVTAFLFFFVLFIAFGVNQSFFVFAGKGSFTKLEHWSIQNMLIFSQIPTFISAICLAHVREGKKPRNDPSKKSHYPHYFALLFWAFFEACSEVAGLSILAYGVLPKISRHYLPVFLLSLGFLPSVFMFISFLISKLKKMALNGVPNVFRAFFSLIIILIGFILFEISLEGNELRIYSAISIILLAFGVTRNYLLFLNESISKWDKHRYKISIAKTFFRIAGLVLTGIRIAQSRGISISSWSEAFNHHEREFVYWVSHVIFANTLYILCYFTAGACIPFFGYGIPVILANIISYFITWDIWTIVIEQSIGFPNDTNIVAFVLLVLGFFVLTFHQFRKINIPALMEDAIFCDHIVMPMISVPHVSLNRNTREKNIYLNWENQTLITFIIGCFYRESEEEMKQFIESAEKVLKESRELNNNSVYKVAVFFDGAILGPKEESTGSISDSGGFEYSQTAEQLQQLLKKLGIEYTHEKWKSGQCWKCRDFDLLFFLKDNKKIKAKKRMSHAKGISMILKSLLFGSDLFGMKAMIDQKIDELQTDEFFKRKSGNGGQKLKHIKRAHLDLLDSSTFVVFTDGDTSFSLGDLEKMRATLKNDPSRVGSVAGKIVPEGDGHPNFLVSAQKFEYAMGQWLQKPTEHVIGSNLCNTGAFTMFRLPAFYRIGGELKGVEPKKNSVEVYAAPVSSGNDIETKELGDDRKLTQEQIAHGWLAQYCSTAVAYTKCPLTFAEFLRQRRRWMITTMANTEELLDRAKEIIYTNRGMSSLYFFYIWILYYTTYFVPSTTIIWLMGSWSYVIGVEFTNWSTIIIGLGIPIFYIICCWITRIDPINDSGERKTRKQSFQSNLSFFLTIIYIPLVVVSTVGLALQMTSDFLEKDKIHQTSLPPINGTILDATPKILEGDPRYMFKDTSSWFFIVLSGLFTFAAIFNWNLLTLFDGLSYLLMLPTFNILMPIYVIANGDDLSWGTRSGDGNKQGTIFSWYNSPIWIQIILKKVFGWSDIWFEKPKSLPKDEFMGVQIPKNTVLERERILFQRCYELRETIAKEPNFSGNFEDVIPLEEIIEKEIEWTILLQEEFQKPADVLLQVVDSQNIHVIFWMSIDFDSIADVNDALQKRVKEYLNSRTPRLSCRVEYLPVDLSNSMEWNRKGFCNINSTLSFTSVHPGMKYVSLVASLQFLKSSPRFLFSSLNYDVSIKYPFEAINMISQKIAPGLNWPISDSLRQSLVFGNYRTNIPSNIFDSIAHHPDPSDCVRWLIERVNPSDFEIVQESNCPKENHFSETKQSFMLEYQLAYHDSQNHQKFFRTLQEAINQPLICPNCNDRITSKVTTKNNAVIRLNWLECKDNLWQKGKTELDFQIPMTFKIGESEFKTMAILCHTGPQIFENAKMKEGTFVCYLKVGNQWYCFQGASFEIVSPGNQFTFPKPRVLTPYLVLGIIEDGKEEILVSNDIINIKGKEATEDFIEFQIPSFDSFVSEKSCKERENLWNNEWARLEKWKGAIKKKRIWSQNDRQYKRYLKRKFQKITDHSTKEISDKEHSIEDNLNDNLETMVDLAWELSKTCKVDPIPKLPKELLKEKEKETEWLKEVQTYISTVKNRYIVASMVWLALSIALSIYPGNPLDVLGTQFHAFVFVAIFCSIFFINFICMLAFLIQTWQYWLEGIESPLSNKLFSFSSKISRTLHLAPQEYNEVEMIEKGEPSASQ